MWICTAATWQYQRAVFSTAGLADSTHTLVVEHVRQCQCGGSGTGTWFLTRWKRVDIVVLSRVEEHSVFGCSQRRRWWHCVESACTWGGTPAVDWDGGGSVATGCSPGSVVRLIARTGPSRGIASVSIDGVSCPNVDLYSASWKYQQVVFSTAGLSDGAHTLVVEHSGSANAAVSGAGTIAIDAVEAAGTSGL